MREELVHIVITNVRKNDYQDIKDWFNDHCTISSKIETKFAKVKVDVSTRNLGLLLFTLNDKFEGTNVENRGVNLVIKCINPTTYKG